MQTDDTHKAIRELEEGSSEQGLEIPIDPTRGGSSSQRLMLRGPRTGQSVILSVDSVETACHGVSGLTGRRFAAIDCSKPTRSSDQLSHIFAGTVCLAISFLPFPAPTRSDSPSCRKHGPRSPISLDLRG